MALRQGRGELVAKFDLGCDKGSEKEMAGQEAGRVGKHS